MKKLLTVTLLAAGFVALPADDAVLRVDVNGVRDNVAFTFRPTEGMKAVPVKQNPEYHIIYSAVKEAGPAEWSDYKIRFTPGTSGTVSIAVGGQYAKLPEERAWLLVNGIRLNGKLYANGDFARTYTAKDGKVVPYGFWLSGKATRLPKAGDQDTPAILVNHDNRLSFNIKVKAGREYEFEFKIRAAASIPAE